LPLIKWITVRLDVSETNGAVTTRKWNHGKRKSVSPLTATKRIGCLRKTTLESRAHVQTVGLNAETKGVGTEPKEKNVS